MFLGERERVGGARLEREGLPLVTAGADGRRPGCRKESMGSRYEGEKDVSLEKHLSPSHSPSPCPNVFRSIKRYIGPMIAFC